MNSLEFKSSRQALGSPCFWAYADNAADSLAEGRRPRASANADSICPSIDGEIEASRAAKCSLWRITNRLLSIESAWRAVTLDVRVGVSCEASAQSIDSMNGSGSVRNRNRYTLRRQAAALSISND